MSSAAKTPFVTQASTGAPSLRINEEPESLPLQPKPIGMIHLYQPRHNQTIVTLNWRPGDPQRCRFCPECSANRHDTCQLVIPGKIEPRTSALFHAGGR